MKTFFFLFAFLAITFSLFGQMGTGNFFLSESQYYRVYSDVSKEQAEEIAGKMEACLRLYNDIFHFGLNQLEYMFKVRLFKEKSVFNSYLEALITETRNDFVYIHFPDSAKSELVGFVKASERELDSSLIHYGCIQFLKAFVPNSPLWLREGVAVYLEYSEYSEESGHFTWQPNLAWVDELKKILSRTTEYIPLSELIMYDSNRAISKINSFYPEAWGLVHFLINYDNKNYNRIIWDAITSLNQAYTLDENSNVVYQKAFGWVDAETFESEFRDYIFSLKTFQDLVREGMELYNFADNTENVDSLDQAQALFLEALTLKPDNHIPHYYLGLIHYSRKDFTKAEEYYSRALQAGVSLDLIYYALGVNAFAADDYDSAEKYLKNALEINPDDENIDTLLKRIEILR